MLVPHVLGPAGTVDADREASVRLLAEVEPRYRDRIALVPDGLGPAETKWFCAQTDWYAGSRMHATIAALSSGVPTAPIAYSYKFRGVFASCGQGDQVVEARKLDTADALDKLWQSWTDRDAIRDDLARHVETPIAQAGAQLDEIVATVEQLSRSAGSVRE
jgi:polysaccharide pyruvyl transferase WcaK-like protein